MPRVSWDADACVVFCDLPKGIPFRVWCYRVALQFSYDQLANMLYRHGLEIDSHTLRKATERVGRQGGLRHCPRCDRLTTSTRYCSECQTDAEDGRMTEREWMRLREHYQQAHVMYGSEHEAEVVDEYVGN